MDFFGVNVISQINVFLISEQLTKAFRLEAFISERPSNSVTPPPTSRVTPPSSASAARPKASVQQSILLAVCLLFSLDLVRFLILNIFKDPNQLRSDLLLQGEETDALPPRFAASEESSGDKEEKEGKAGKDSSKKEKTEKTEKKAKEVKNKDKKKKKTAAKRLMMVTRKKMRILKTQIMFPSLVKRMKTTVMMRMNRQLVVAAKVKHKKKTRPGKSQRKQPPKPSRPRNPPLSKEKLSHVCFHGNTWTYFVALRAFFPNCQVFKQP